MARIVVAGSLNVDLTVRAERWPAAGETLFGTAMERYPGGKGANQAAAAAALGGDVALAGRVGDDEGGRLVLASLRGFGVDTRPVAVDPEAPTGTAVIGVEADGANRIVVIPGANARLSAADLGRIPWGDARVLLLQLEIPVGTVLAAAREARARGIAVVLDPAPPRDLPDELWSLVDLLVPNRTEAEALAGLPVGDAAAARQVAARLCGRGPRAAIVKLGADGAVLAEGNEIVHVPGLRVATVDTTAAGDAFAGALAVALTEGRPLAAAVSFAVRAAALSTTRSGAQSSLPRRDEVERMAQEPPTNAFV